MICSVIYCCSLIALEKRSTDLFTLSNIFQRGMAWYMYLSMERDFIDITRYVALEKDNSQVWSEKIADLLQLTGGRVNNLFREMRTSSLLPSSGALTALKSNDRPTIEDYRAAFEPTYELSGVELTAHHGLTNYGNIRPFDPFQHDNYPAWWNAYNKVKHGSFDEMRNGTLENLLHALGALFILNVLHKDGQEYLLKMGVIRVEHFPPGHPDIWKMIKSSYFGVPKNVQLEYWASSEVFQHVFRKDATTVG
jgi:hypothetical protein